MSVCWMFMVLLACMASHAAQSQSTCTCSEKFTKQITICSPSTETVYVPCPNMTADIMTFTLLKDEEIISNQTCNKEQDAQNCTLVRFSLNEMTHRSSGIYRCEGRSIFPPPSIKVQSDLRIRIHVGHHKNCTGINHKKCDNPFLWIWILVVVLLSIYSISVTIIAFRFWVKLRKTDSSDYMNTKPRAQRDRRKKKGVQNPIPRHF
ncbi:T-cell-specific surface glycoprotein CD28 isoform X1 [Lates calcarifer]|uniref:T-cell-specific surface glycoprotein CD28 isoform X1 n=2 Tax=Lates calcarifer TaxID=8187 RepID=A0AAJ7PBW6_LATCA|nr:T-cell-specific surface glycoprotein CD28 isoform X1 [Lates calcarifer]